MRIEISDDTYQKLSETHSDVPAFLEQLAKNSIEQPSIEQPQKSFYDALAEDGLIGCIKDAPSDLSTNPQYMEDFGK